MAFILKKRVVFLVYYLLSLQLILGDEVNSIENESSGGGALEFATESQALTSDDNSETFLNLDDRKLVSTNDISFISPPDNAPRYESSTKEVLGLGNINTTITKKNNSNALNTTFGASESRSLQPSLLLSQTPSILTTSADSPVNFNAILLALKDLNLLNTGHVPESTSSDTNNPIDNLNSTSTPKTTTVSGSTPTISTTSSSSAIDTINGTLYYTSNLSSFMDKATKYVTDIQNQILGGALLLCTAVIIALKKVFGVLRSCVYRNRYHRTGGSLRRVTRPEEELEML